MPVCHTGGREFESRQPRSAFFDIEVVGCRSAASLGRVEGAVAQLGERLNGIQEVEGSIPFRSTFFLALRLFLFIQLRPFCLELALTALFA